jgi:peroxiredoxin
MKRNLSIFIILILISPFSTMNAQTFSFKPEKPLPGEKVTVKFNPAGTPLENSNNIEMFTYFYKQELTDTKSSEMKKSGKTWSGTFSTGKEDLGVIIIFKDEDENTVNNDQRGFVVHLYNNKGEILPGSIAGLGYAYIDWTTQHLNFERDHTFGIELMEKDLEKNPSLKETFVRYYYPVKSYFNKERSIEIVQEGISILEKKKDPDEKDYLTLIEFYKMISHPDGIKKYEEIANNKYPLGLVAQRRDFSAITPMEDSEEKISRLKEFIMKFSESGVVPAAQGQIIRMYLASKDYEKLKTYLSENKENIKSFLYYDAAHKILKAEGDASLALEITMLGDEARNYEKLKEKKPVYLSESQWLKQKEELKSFGSFSRGRALYELNRTREALNDLKGAWEKSKGENPEINLYYTKALMIEGKYETAFDVVSELISEGASSSELNKLFEEIYIKVKGTGNGYKEHAAALTKKSYKKIAAQLEKEMINEPAPDFKLVDLDGNEVSFEQYKGKIVIIDFWATWCGPCLQSFPALKNSVEKYKDNEEVKFLFINTWERVQDKKKNAADFIAKNSYPFHVLMDQDNKVIEQYKVSGIPTKFIIDKNGNIRFKSIGFSGSIDKLVTEIDVMISMLE